MYNWHPKQLLAFCSTCIRDGTLYLRVFVAHSRCQTGAKTNGRRPNTAGYINNLHDDRNHKHTNADRPSKSGK